MALRKKPAKKKRPEPIVLKGGLKDVEASEIRQGKRLGGTTEGIVSEVEVVLGRGKTRKMVEKRFHTMHKRYPFPFRDPVRQYQTMRELSRINREKKLGLRIVPTIRLRRMEEEKEHRLVMTRLDAIDPKKLSKPQYANYLKDVERQKALLGKQGYRAGGDSFLPVIDPKTGKTVAVIADFGSIYKP